jgi:hypothetical protein
MRASLLPLALVALALPVPANAYPNTYPNTNPNTYQRFTYETYGPPPIAYAPQPVYTPQPIYAPQPVYKTRVRFAPRPVSGYGSYPVATYPGAYAAPVRSCSLAAPLVGAALGGSLGVAMANGHRNRRWAVPMGAAFGGILGGVASGC